MIELGQKLDQKLLIIQMGQMINTLSGQKVTQFGFDKILKNASLFGRIFWEIVRT